MKIGFIKFGLKTRFNGDGTGQGSNHELIDVFNIFKERGHECVMLSNNDLNEDWKLQDVENLDYIFVFNGPLCKGFESNLGMFQGTCISLNLLKNTKTPWAYFWTDPRKDYDIRRHEIYKDNPPIAILSQEKEFYGHLDKLRLYKRQAEIQAEKILGLVVLMNYTDPNRSKKLLSDLNWVKEYNPKILGNWKKIEHPFIAGKLDEDEVLGYMRKVQYSYNIGKNKKWVSQKYWEMVLSNVICFYSNYDEDNLLMESSDFRRVKDGIELEEKITQLEKDAQFRNEIVENQLKEFKLEYYDGSFIYNLIKEKIK